MKSPLPWMSVAMVIQCTFQLQFPFVTFVIMWWNARRSSFQMIQCLHSRKSGSGYSSGHEPPMGAMLLGTLAGSRWNLLNKPARWGNHIQWWPIMFQASCHYLEWWKCRAESDVWLSQSLHDCTVHSARFCWCTVYACAYVPIPKLDESWSCPLLILLVVHTITHYKLFCS